MKIRKSKSVQILVADEYYKFLQKRRKKYMKKHKLNKLATTDFTRVLLREYKKKKK